MRTLSSFAVGLFLSCPLWAGAPTDFPSCSPGMDQSDCSAGFNNNTNQTVIFYAHRGDERCGGLQVPSLDPLNPICNNGGSTAGGKMTCNIPPGGLPFSTILWTDTTCSGFGIHLGISVGGQDVEFETTIDASNNFKGSGASANGISLSIDDYGNLTIGSERAAQEAHDREPLHKKP